MFTLLTLSINLTHCHLWTGEANCMCKWPSGHLWSCLVAHFPDEGTVIYGGYRSCSRLELGLSGSRPRALSTSLICFHLSTWMGHKRSEALGKKMIWFLKDASITTSLETNTLRNSCKLCRFHKMWNVSWHAVFPISKLTEPESPKAAVSYNWRVTPLLDGTLLSISWASRDPAPCLTWPLQHLYLWPLD